MLDRAQKAQEISSISERFQKANATFLVDYKGMNVEQITRLRRELHPTQSELRVVRNRLTQIAIKDRPEGSAYEGQLAGTNAVVFSYGDPSASAKLLSEFSKEVEQLVLKAGFLDGQMLGRENIEYLATLPSIDVLRAQFLGLLSAPASKFVRLLNEVPSKFVRVLQARVDKG